MNSNAALQQILDDGIIAVVRASDSSPLIETAQALASGGVRTIELTFTIPDALEVIRTARRTLPAEVLIGAGTVLDCETARAALLAGADFIVGPTFDPEVVRLCRRYSKVVMPGAFTPTEILAAWSAGADIVKVFPAEVLGPAFFKALRGPLPQVRVMPTGGVDIGTAAAFLNAGACCLGIGSQLVDPAALAARDFERIREAARTYRRIVDEFRGRTA